MNRQVPDPPSASQADGASRVAAAATGAGSRTATAAAAVSGGFAAAAVPASDLHGGSAGVAHVLAGHVRLQLHGGVQPSSYSIPSNCQPELRVPGSEASSSVDVTPREDQGNAQPREQVRVLRTMKQLDEATLKALEQRVEKFDLKMADELDRLDAVTAFPDAADAASAAATAEAAAAVAARAAAAKAAALAVDSASQSREIARSSLFEDKQQQARDFWASELNSLMVEAGLGAMLQFRSLAAAAALLASPVPVKLSIDGGTATAGAGDVSMDDAGAADASSTAEAAGPTLPATRDVDGLEQPLQLGIGELIRAIILAQVTPALRQLASADGNAMLDAAAADKIGMDRKTRDMQRTRNGNHSGRNQRRGADAASRGHSAQARSKPGPSPTAGAGSTLQYPHASAGADGFGKQGGARAASPSSLPDASGSGGAAASAAAASAPFQPRTQPSQTRVGRLAAAEAAVLEYAGWGSRGTMSAGNSAAHSHSAAVGGRRMLALDDGRTQRRAILARLRPTNALPPPPLQHLATSTAVHAAAAAAASASAVGTMVVGFSANRAAKFGNLVHNAGSSRLESGVGDDGEEDDLMAVLFGGASSSALHTSDDADEGDRHMRAGDGDGTGNGDASLLKAQHRMRKGEQLKLARAARIRKLKESQQNGAGGLSSSSSASVSAAGASAAHSSAGATVTAEPDEAIEDTFVLEPKLNGGPLEDDKPPTAIDESANVMHDAGDLDLEGDRDGGADVAGRSVSPAASPTASVDTVLVGDELDTLPVASASASPAASPSPLAAASSAGRSSATATSSTAASPPAVAAASHGSSAGQAIPSSTTARGSAATTGPCASSSTSPAISISSTDDATDAGPIAQLILPASLRDHQFPTKASVRNVDIYAQCAYCTVVNSVPARALVGPNPSCAPGRPLTCDTCDSRLIYRCRNRDCGALNRVRQAGRDEADLFCAACHSALISPSAGYHSQMAIAGNGAGAGASSSSSAAPNR